MEKCLKFYLNTERARWLTFWQIWGQIETYFCITQPHTQAAFS